MLLSDCCCVRQKSSALFPILCPKKRTLKEERVKRGREIFSSFSFFLVSSKGFLCVLLSVICFDDFRIEKNSFSPFLSAYNAIISFFFSSSKQHFIVDRLKKQETRREEDGYNFVSSSQLSLSYSICFVQVRLSFPSFLPSKSHFVQLTEKRKKDERDEDQKKKNRKWKRCSFLSCKKIFLISSKVLLAALSPILDSIVFQSLT